MWHAIAVFMNVASAAVVQVVNSLHKAKSVPCDVPVSRMSVHAEAFMHKQQQFLQHKVDADHSLSSAIE